MSNRSYVEEWRKEIEKLISVVAVAVSFVEALDHSGKVCTPTCLYWKDDPADRECPEDCRVLLADNKV